MFWNLFNYEFIDMMQSKNDIVCGTICYDSRIL